MDTFHDFTMVDPPDPSDFDDIPTVPYTAPPVVQAAPNRWHVQQNPLRLVRVG